MAKIIADYTNGNAHVILENDGTRIIETNDDEFDFEYPCNIDVTITHQCDLECDFCYLGCNKNGKHADILGAKFFDTLLPGTECAINLNNMSHPQLPEFLVKMKNRGIFVNGTINQRHFMKHWKTLYQWTKEGLINGIGISLVDANDEFLDLLKYFPNAVIHVIVGVVSGVDIERMKNRNIKMLILGYKDIRRGSTYKDNHHYMMIVRKHYLYHELPKLIDNFAVISFDNLAIDQLDAQRLVPKDKWDEIYQGDEGTMTFAVDLVDGTFSRSSSETLTFKIMDDVRDMFKVVKNLK